ncbi:hypothetical protein H2204_009268 [Knufia peltigerae]|uniref:CFEM domain-containing protein n=1 Tax=Knufia peltigerae TaxID=1002370 RepID=A0AA39CW44_9EURO|nr:hypothetical protein H2204_009268 [Knufia peltigerae]
MKTVAIGAVAFALALKAHAQDITSLPVCAQSPILTAFSTSGCSLTDIACVCNNTEFINGLVNTIPSVCNANEVAATSQFAVSLCASYGVTLDLPGTPGGATSSASATTSEVVPVTTAPVEPTIASSSATPSSVNGPTTAETPAISGTSSSEPAQYTGAGSKVRIVLMPVFLGAVALGLAAAI